MRFVEGLAIREIRRRTGLHRETIRRALRSATPPVYERPARASKLDPFKDEIHRLLRDDAGIESQRIREILIGLGFEGGRTIVDDYVREVRRSFGASAPTSGPSTDPGTCCSSICGSRSGRFRSATPRRARGTWSSARSVSRALAAARWCSPRRRRTCCGGCRGAPGGSARCRDGWWSTARAACTPAAAARPTSSPHFAGSCRSAGGSSTPGCQAKGVVERLQGFMGTSFEPGRSFCNELDFQDQLDRWFDERANVRLHRTLRERPVDRLEREREALRSLPEPGPDLDRRIVLRVPPQPFVHVDRNDYSLDPRLVGRRVEVRVSVARGRRRRARHRRAGRLSPARVRRRAGDHRSCPPGGARASAARALSRQASRRRGRRAARPVGL
jgi:hypothetical protein